MTTTNWTVPICCGMPGVSRPVGLGSKLISASETTSSPTFDELPAKATSWSVATTANPAADGGDADAADDDGVTSELAVGDPPGVVEGEAVRGDRGKPTTTT